MNSPARAVFFDRDGTLMEDVDYCKRPEDVRLFPGVAEALKTLKADGFLTIVITNQSGIGRGYLSEREYHAVHAQLLRLIGPGLIDAAYFCADVPWQHSTRRKPAPGMVMDAAAEHGIDLARSWFVGDKDTDIECGRRAGVRTILVETGQGAQHRGSGADFIARDIVEAAEWILREGSPGARHGS
jgi:D-glycero-D-manno-heptose 1,7-bisphosphate phosphatase